ncbi:MAG: RlpA-like double-psi beta-barrel domain-containing protein [Pseudolabrys sp.]
MLVGFLLVAVRCAFASADKPAEPHVVVAIPRTEQARAAEPPPPASPPSHTVAPNYSPAPPLERALLLIEQYGPSAAAAIVGIASTYNPYVPNDLDAGGAETASGELYDPTSWTAAIQIGLRGLFGGVRFGRNYRPSFALVESGGRRAIVKINDVGPLRPGRIIDLNERAMRYFDPTMRRGIIDGVRVTPLAGEEWTPGPVATPRMMTAAAHVD